MRFLNRAQLIGNVCTEISFSVKSSGHSFCHFVVATNRKYKDSQGNLQDEATFHNVICWDKVAEFCRDALAKGKIVFVEGHMNHKKRDDGTMHHEVVAHDLILPDKREEGVELPQ